MRISSSKSCADCLSAGFEDIILRTMVAKLLVTSNGSQVPTTSVPCNCAVPCSEITGVTHRDTGVVHWLRLKESDRASVAIGDARGDALGVVLADKRPDIDRTCLPTTESTNGS